MDRRSFLTSSALSGLGSAAWIAAGPLVSTLPAAAPNISDDWPQWRGPTRDSQITAERWSGIGEGQLTRKWRVPLGPSYSTPIVSGSRVFITETRDKKEEVVSALDRNSGEKLWDAKWKGSMKVPFFAAANGSWIRCTPAVDAERVYVGGMKDVLAAFDVDNGDEVWRLDCVEKFSTSVPSFGFVASPLVDGEFLYAQAGGGLLKLKRATGEVVWRSLVDGGGMYGSAFSSPIIATIAGQRQLVALTRQDLCGVDIESGEKLWSQKVPSFRGMNILTPLPIGDVIFTSPYKNGSRAYAVSRDNGVYKVTEAWTDKADGYMSSPVLVDGFVYLHLGNRRVACYEASTGTKRWTSSETFGKYWSMVANGSQILALDQEGELLLINATPESLQIVERRKVSDDETWGHLAIAGRQAFVRELNAAAMYQWEV